jgi:hypothetical protein
MELASLLPEGFTVYPKSVREVQGAALALVKGPDGKHLFLTKPLAPFGQLTEAGGGYLAPLTYETAVSLGELLPELRPKRLPAGPSFGFGDRLGNATPGHIRALSGARVFPILAQQSVRENARTGRSFPEVLATAVFGALEEGFTGGFGADADHLKRVEDAQEAAKLGYTFFTCDPSDLVKPVERLPDDELARRFQSLAEVDEIKKAYSNRNFSVKGLGRVHFSERELVVAAVKYARAIELAVEMYRAIAELAPRGFDFELSLDEGESPTTPVEHYYVASELRRRGVELASLAPRFGGAMEKAVDYRGSLEVFKRDLRAHVAIARALGPYRISLHSGSDKFSLYPILAQEGEGLWHVKTAGTSYLVALKVVAEIDPSLFREIFALSLDVFERDRATYHLSTDLSAVPRPEMIPDEELPGLLEEDNSRQVLHVAYGSVLKSELGPRLKALLAQNEEAYYAALASHLGRHLQALGVKKNG